MLQGVRSQYTFGVLCFVVLLLLSSNISGAQEASAQVKRFELQVLQKEAGYRAAQDDLSKLDLLYTYENLAQAICMPRFHKSLQFAGKPESKECLNVLDKIKGLREPSLVSTCIQEGFDSKACKEGYAHQLALPRSSLPSRLFHREEGSDVYSEPEALPNDFLNTKKRYVQSKDLTNLRKMTGAIRPAVIEACATTTLRLVQEGDLPLSRDEYFREDGKEDRVDTLLKELQGEQKTEGAFPHMPAKKDDRVRVRVLGDRCTQLLEAILAVHPLSSMAICERDGAYSHNCATAIVQERRFVQELKSKPKKASPSQTRKSQGQKQTGQKEAGFSTF